MAGSRTVVRYFFVLFFVSGFCSVLYELVWLRLAMAEFGVTTALVSIVVSVFMAGMGLGSWAAGALVRRQSEKSSALVLYALTELLIGISSLLVPKELALAQSLFATRSLTSVSYYVFSATSVTLALLPWCACMGATIPLGMQAIRRIAPNNSQRSFSLLYMANVCGALLGAIVPLLLVELTGFHRTLVAGALGNAAIALSALLLAKKVRAVAPEAIANADAADESATPSGSNLLLVLLFLTGFTSMGLEVVWIRLFTPYLGTVVYAFAFILVAYLAGTAIGSRLYRRFATISTEDSTLLWLLLAATALFPLLVARPEARFLGNSSMALAIAPFTGLLGFFTPMLVDRWSQGDPARAGSAYALNVVGCILGPLVAGFLLLPYLAEHWVLLAFASPWIVFGIISVASQKGARWRVAIAAATLLAFTVWAISSSETYSYENRSGRVLRDHTATIVASGSGMNKILLVNGYGITALTPITKMMAHLPLASLDQPPRNALVICFGMGTTFRSLMSWGIPVTAVELVPSVPRVFDYYHSDAPRVLSSPLGHIVIDDGRRYLKRSTDQYDVITIDPPPPVEAAASSMLYSEEFYAVVKRRLRPGGILQQWLPEADVAVLVSVAKALDASFPYVRVYGSRKYGGWHFLASDHPIPVRSGAELVQRMPSQAVADLMEWGPEKTPDAEFDAVLTSRLRMSDIVSLAPKVPAMRDDRPVNEYYVVRRDLIPSSWKGMEWSFQ